MYRAMDGYYIEIQVSTHFATQSTSVSSYKPGGVGSTIKNNGLKKANCTRGLIFLFKVNPWIFVENLESHYSSGVDLFNGTVVK